MLIVSFFFSTSLIGPLSMAHGFNQNESSEVFDGYLLTAPIYSKKTYLINNQRQVVHTWESDYSQALGTYLLEDGTMLRSTRASTRPAWIRGGYHGRIERVDSDGDILWEFEYFNKTRGLHNDIEPLPNGNILMITFERKTQQQALNAGMNPKYINNEFYVDGIIEVKPTGKTTGEIVWEWNVWDHLIQDYDESKENYGIIKDHPELIDINLGFRRFFIPDYAHLNSLDYHEEWDQILVSARMLNEIFVIDHSTTTEEAAGHNGGRYGKGGDLLYRWGNPFNYRHGSKDDQQLFAQHDVEWIPDGYPGQGHITIYNNGWDRPGIDYSSVMEIIPPVNQTGHYDKKPNQPFAPAHPLWTYISPFSYLLQSDICGTIIALKNGHFIIGTGYGGEVLFELNDQKDVIWWYLNPYPIPVRRINPIFQTQFYPADYPGLDFL